MFSQVRHISEDPPCKCPNKFCVERQSQGRYRVGEKILFIRVGTLLYKLYVQGVASGTWRAWNSKVVSDDPF